MNLVNPTATEEYVTIETHFGVPGHFIRADTRNKCSENLVAMLEGVAAILYPDEQFDIYLLTPEPGSYKDFIKFTKKHKIGATIGTVATVSGIVFLVLNYRDTHEAHLNDEKMWVVENTSKCLDLQTKINEIREKGYEIAKIPTEKISEVCGDLALIKRKNGFYSTLENDRMVLNNEIILRDEEFQPVLSQKVERADFQKYIETTPDQKFSIDDVEGTVELISLVLKQKKEGRGIPWKGIYYGDTVYYKELSVLKEGDDLEFYMQDSDFKNQISNKERAFTAGDNMRIVFTVSGEIKAGKVASTSTYIKEVKSYNEEMIPHKSRSTKNPSAPIEGQIRLF